MKLSKEQIQKIIERTRTWKGETADWINDMLDTIESQEQEIAQRDEALRVARKALKIMWDFEDGSTDGVTYQYDKCQEALSAIEKALGESHEN
jgi:hypothetical protein